MIPSHSYSYDRRCPLRFSYESFSGSSVPRSSASIAFFGRSFTGVSSENLNRRASPSMIATRYWAVPPDFCHGSTAPCFNERSGFASTRSASGSSLVPRPVHAGHAPCGELNENIRGSISPIEKSPSGQARRWLKRRSGCLPSASATSTSPSPSRSAVSIESVSLERSASPSSPRFMTMRSTTTSSECFFILSSVISGQVANGSVHAHPREAPAPRRHEKLLVFTLPISHERSEDEETRALLVVADLV